MNKGHGIKTRQGVVCPAARKTTRKKRVSPFAFPLKKVKVLFVVVVVVV